MSPSQRTPGGRAPATQAIVFEEPRQLSLRTVNLTVPGAADIRVRTRFSGISTGTERLLYEGRMPHFPGLAYPLVPGYETVGEVVWAGVDAPFEPGTTVFVPGAACYSEVQALFGGAAAELVAPAARAVPLPAELAQADAVLLSLAATAHHILEQAPKPDLIVGHGVLGRLLARLLLARQHRDFKVWEAKPERRTGAADYAVVEPTADDRRGLRQIVDVSGDAGILNALLPKLAPRGEIVLGGFYAEQLRFAFPPAFMCEACIRVAAEFTPADLAAVIAAVETGALSLDGLLTHQSQIADAAAAYEQAFADPTCLKMALAWEETS
ncbi:MAG: chlorophyll synthesis pathway protein BchC [Pseudomonadota bacterium]